MLTTSTTTEEPLRRRMTRMPSHPGGILKRMYMEPLGLTVTKLAEVLGVSRKHLSAVLNERVGVTPDMSLRLSRAFNTTPGIWLDMQQTYSLWCAEHEATGWKNVVPVTSATASPDGAETTR